MLNQIYSIVEMLLGPVLPLSTQMCTIKFLGPPFSSTVTKGLGVDEI